MFQTEFSDSGKRISKDRAGKIILIVMMNDMIYQCQQQAIEPSLW